MGCMNTWMTTSPKSSSAHCPDVTPSTPSGRRPCVFSAMETESAIASTCRSERPLTSRMYSVYEHRARTSSKTGSSALVSRAAPRARWAASSAPRRGLAFACSMYVMLFCGWVFLTGLRLDLALGPHLSISSDDELRRGESLGPHRAVGMQSGGRHADLGAEAELAAVGEAGGRIDQHGRRTALAEEALGRLAV